MMDEVKLTERSTKLSKSIQEMGSIVETEQPANLKEEELLKKEEGKNGRKEGFYERPDRSQ
jgi:hypothetical protein